LTEPRVVAGKRAALEAVRAGDVIEVLIADDLRRTAGLRELLDAARSLGVAVRPSSRADLDSLAEDHRGVVARLLAGLTTLSERDLGAFEFDDDAIVVVLDGIGDPQNLGAAARAAEAAGVAMLVTRTRRAAPVTPAAVRASAGALSHLPHARVANISRAIERLQRSGFSVVGLEGGAEGSIDDVACPAGRVALVVGSEGEGISRLVREHCDVLVSIPMRGRVSSLNASSALAAALWAFVLPSRRR
jgi:23S rRNA (guanosine2251-2'-O)-methyltransferase